MTIFINIYRGVYRGHASTTYSFGKYLLHSMLKFHGFECAMCGSTCVKCKFLKYIG